MRHGPQCHPRRKHHDALDRPPTCGDCQDEAVSHRYATTGAGGARTWSSRAVLSLVIVGLPSPVGRCDHRAGLLADVAHALADPSSLRDLDALEEVEQRLARDDLDVAERLELLLRRRTLNQVDIGPLEDAFVSAVPEYLAELGLDVTEAREDFTAVGVPPEVLDRAACASSTRDGSASVDGVRSYALSRGSAFTQKDLMEATGASRGTVGKVIKALCEEGRVVAGSSRPIVYELR